MGIVKPSWVIEEWFTQCPFNYCDHFGTQEVLATMCIICRDDVQRKKLYKKAGKDPYDVANVFSELANSLVQIHQMVEKHANEQGIDLDSIPDEEDTAPKCGTYPIFNLIQEYGDSVEKVIHNLSEVPASTELELVMKAMDALSHSRSYIIAKTARALHSQYEEKSDEIMQDLADSKTSALFAYMAIERNSRALTALAYHPPLHHLRKKHVALAKASLSLAQMFRENFFPNERVVYEEFGTEEYDTCFEKYALSRE